MQALFRTALAALPISQMQELMPNKNSGSLYHCFTRRELAACSGENRRRVLEKLAGRLAAKKAVLRAMNLPTDQPVYWPEVEILPRPDGQPRVLFSEDLRQKHLPTGCSVLISISHGRTHALAIAAILCPKAQGETFF